MWMDACERASLSWESGMGKQFYTRPREGLTDCKTWQSSGRGIISWMQCIYSLLICSECKVNWNLEMEVASSYN